MRRVVLRFDRFETDFLMNFPVQVIARGRKSSTVRLEKDTPLPSGWAIAGQVVRVPTAALFTVVD